VLYTLRDHWLEQAERHVSPNCGSRPASVDIDLIVIHNISLPPEEYGNGNVARFFCNQLDCSAHPYFEHIKALRVSSHVFIQRDGNVIQFVPFDQRAWHAGVSQYRGRNACNDFSIGIELEGSDFDPYEDAQYRALAKVVNCLLDNYPTLTSEAIVGHSDIAPQRKTDPGPAFQWQRFRQELAKERNSRFHDT